MDDTRKNLYLNGYRLKEEYSDYEVWFNGEFEVLVPFKQLEEMADSFEEIA